MDEGNADVAGAGVSTVGAVAGKIMSGDDAQPAVTPQLHRHRLVAAFGAHIEPQEEAALRAPVAVAVADDLIGKIELGDIERAVVLDMGLVGIGRNGDLLHRNGHLRRGDVAKLHVASEEAAVAGGKTNPQAGEVGSLRQ